MTREEKSLLLFFETCVVDHGGLVDIAHMNESDWDIAKRWDVEGFVSFGRVLSEHLKLTGKYSHWCELSEKAWGFARDERYARAARMNKNRTWRKTTEKHENKPR